MDKKIKQYFVKSIITVLIMKKKVEAFQGKLIY